MKKFCMVLLVMVMLVSASPMSLFAQDPEEVPFDSFNPIQSNCQSAPSTYFGVGDSVQMIPEWRSLGLYAFIEPATVGGEYIPQLIQSSETFQVLDGPICYADGNRYWLMQFGPGFRGWINDGVHIPGAPAGILFFDVVSRGSGITQQSNAGGSQQTNTGVNQQTGTGSGETSTLNCQASPPQYLELGDVVMLKEEFWQYGIRLLQDLEAVHTTWVGDDLTSEELILIEGPICAWQDGARYWQVQNVADPGQVGWIADGNSVAGEVYYFLFKIRHQDLETVVRTADGICPVETTQLAIDMIVEPSRDDVRIYDRGLWARNSWYQWYWGYLTIVGGPVCDHYLRYWLVQDLSYGYGGWVIERYNGEPNIVPSTGNFRAEPNSGYSSTLAGDVSD